MRYRLTFVCGVAVGYVFGTRAGRERYDQLRKTARGIAQNPAVRNTVESAAQTSRACAGKVADVVAGKVGDRLPAGITDRVRSLRERCGPSDDGWGSGGA